ncbi:MAG: bile acid:sodium symporter [Spirochaetes bacterium]|nr:bile acid:sodium symporter [Spirochaetota bacterium]
MKRGCVIAFVTAAFCAAALSQVAAAQMSGEEQYRVLSEAAAGKTGGDLFGKLNEESRGLDWEKAEAAEFEGNLRLMKMRGDDRTGVYFLRKLTGEILILSVPAEADPLYADLGKLTESRMVFKVRMLAGTVGGDEYLFARFSEAPKGLLFERIFKISMVLMLFLVMVGMGLTLTLNDFAVVFKKPLGIIVGLIMQYGIMPLVALGLSYVFGFYHAYPFIFIGLILVTAIPAGVTSNLLTLYAKGDLALSVSLTSFSTILSLVFTPLLLTLYGAGVSEVSVPAGLIAQTIVVLVIVPLAIGMAVRAKWKTIAEKLSRVFSALGIVAVLFIMVAGVLSNLHVFSDTARYSPTFYVSIFVLAVVGMLVGWGVAKIVRVSDVQAKSIAFETGIRNSTLGMAIALLIQDSIGDFYSSMFIVTGIYGLEMYVAGIAAIFLFKRFYPAAEGEAAK